MLINRLTVKQCVTLYLKDFKEKTTYKSLEKLFSST